MTEMTAEGYAVRKALGLAPEADGADVLAEIGWLQQSATPPPAGSAATAPPKQCGVTTCDGRACTGWVDPESEVCELEDEHHGTAGIEPWATGENFIDGLGYPWRRHSNGEESPADPPPPGSGECQECDGTGTTYSAGYYVPGEQFTEPPTGPDMCESCNGTGRIPAPPPAGDGFAWARAQLASPPAGSAAPQETPEGGELAEWADALEANAQDMRDGFEASEPDIRNAASAIRAHRCQPSAATAPQENAHRQAPGWHDALDRDQRRAQNDRNRCQDCGLIEACNCRGQWDAAAPPAAGPGEAVDREYGEPINLAEAERAGTWPYDGPAAPPAAPAAAVDRDALVRAFMAAERVHSDRWRYLPERADWAEAEAMADVALAEIERQRREQP